MSDVVPTFESVFTEDYWSPVPAMLDFKSKYLLPRLAEVNKRHGSGAQGVTREMNEQIETIIGQSVVQLLASEPIERVQEDELVGGPDDNKYALPGNVLLVDTEEVLLRKNPVQLVADPYFMHEGELLATAPSLLLRNLTPMPRTSPSTTKVLFDSFPPSFRNLAEWFGVDTQTEKDLGERGHYLKPYRRRYINPEIGLYRRYINLYGFCPNVDGKTVSIAMQHISIGLNNNVWTYAPAGRTKKLGFVGMPVYARVGETINRTVSEYTKLERIRSAYLCMRGSLEYAKDRQKQRKHVFVGMLAINPPSAR